MIAFSKPEREKGKKSEELNHPCLFRPEKEALRVSLHIFFTLKQKLIYYLSTNLIACVMTDTYDSPSYNI